jgi:hypothetical protein
VRLTICIACGVPTTNGSRCQRCNRGFRRAMRNTAYDTAEWRRRRKVELAEARRQPDGARCSRCGRLEDPADLSTKLTLGHRVALARGGELLGPTDVICRRCNTQQRWRDTPTRRR